MKSKLFIVGALLLIVWSCQQGPAEAETESKSNWKPEMDKPSELAQIMRNIHDEAKSRKASLEAGELGAVNSDLAFGMITATPTEPHMVGPAFEPHAKAFMKSYAAIASTQSVEEQINAHDNLVKSCVACHMNFCQGPIPRIEKLYIQGVKS